MTKRAPKVYISIKTQSSDIKKKKKKRRASSRYVNWITQSKPFYMWKHPAFAFFLPPHFFFYYYLKKILSLTFSAYFIYGSTLFYDAVGVRQNGTRALFPVIGNGSLRMATYLYVEFVFWSLVEYWIRAGWFMAVLMLNRKKIKKKKFLEKQ